MGTKNHAKGDKKYSEWVDSKKDKQSKNVSSQKISQKGTSKKIKPQVEVSSMKAASVTRKVKITNPDDVWRVLVICSEWVLKYNGIHYSTSSTPY